MTETSAVPPDPYPGELLCRGSYALGTACGRCARCLTARAAMEQTGALPPEPNRIDADTITPATIAAVVQRVREVEEAMYRAIADAARQLLDVKIEVGKGATCGQPLQYPVARVTWTRRYK